MALQPPTSPATAHAWHGNRSSKLAYHENSVQRDALGTWLSLMTLWWNRVILIP